MQLTLSGDAPESGLRSGSPRVALFTDTFEEVNGVAKTFRRLVDEFSRRHVPLDVYTYGRQMSVERIGSVDILRFDHRVSHNYYEHLRYELLPDRRLGAAFTERMRERGYQLVHIVAPGSMGWTGRSLGLRHGLPLVGSYHTSFAEYLTERWPRVLAGPLDRLAWSIMRRFYGPCRKVLCPTQAICRQLQAKGFPMDLGVFTRGIDSTLFSRARRRASNSVPCVVYVGRLAPEKNVRALPEILHGEGFTVSIVGDGPERAWLEARLPKATFHGYLEDTALAQAYADADVLVFPSRTDTFGNVVLEAMSSGVVPVVLDAPGPRDFVSDGTNAIVCKDEDSMRRAVERLVNDAEMRRELSDNARTYAANRDWNSVFDRLIEDYEGVAQ